MLRSIFVSGLILGALTLSPRIAHAGDCGFDSDCPGEQICLDQARTESSEGLEACEADSDRHVGACADGFCKRDAVHCSTEDGDYCRVGQSSLVCECSDGSGFGEVGGSPVPDPLPDPDSDELYAKCLESIAMCEDHGGDGDDDPEEPPNGDGDGEPEEPPNGDGDGDGDGGQGGEDDEAKGDDDNDDIAAGRGCQVSDTSGWGLAALALLGLRRTRRRR